ncbi:conserved protein of unknown function [Candidatus Filomicrobium marinum]|uniref:Uncharacterized protein n=1 Tax=Candidatus Filomicrobium marinum TaxID=1608628 RepID=A0A0D6JDC6_9HYPH|nr:conserved protein of unknown function [Candidatus Filomicrobium marinum]CPR16976.1 conserved protein of unknown function [Candidatus Filomicrobium marinum]
MSTTKTRRGRPKGTGIDDRVPLIQIAALIAADPELKPTTAIRRIGVTEPSVIRRLRDKFKVFLAQQNAELNIANSQTAAAPAVAERTDARLAHDKPTQKQDSEKQSLSATGSKKKPALRKSIRFTSKTKPQMGLEIRA